MGWRVLVWLALAVGGAPALAHASPPIASFDVVAYSGVPDPQHRNVAPGHFANPVLPGFQPDPSIVRVGEDFYLVNSTFAWFPGLPVYHSRDLVHWQQIGNAIDRPDQLSLKGLGVTRGLFAPTISHHGGKFYILNTCVDCGSNFILTAANPAGPWSDPHWLPFDGIDPSLFVDTDGRAWIVYNDAPAGPAEYAGHRALWLQEIDLAKFALIGARRMIIDKGVRPQDKPVWIEGPHIFKVGRYYYLSAAEGGTADQHSQTIYRAEAVTGPYLPGPDNPILTQRDLPADRPWPVQATGHADFVELADKSWWAVILATRPYAGQQTSLGRETFLLPVTWEGDWPTILPHGTAIEPTSKAPRLPAFQGDNLDAWREEFSKPGLAADWLMLRTPEGAPWWSIAAGSLRLEARPVAAGELQQPSFLGKRLRHNDATVETIMRFTPEAQGDRAGLLALIDESHFLFLGVEQLADGKPYVVLRRRGAAGDPAEGSLVEQQLLADSNDVPISLRMHIDRGNASFAWRKGGAWTPLADKVDASVLASIGAGLFTGTVIGPHAARAVPTK